MPHPCDAPTQQEQMAVAEGIRLPDPTASGSASEPGFPVIRSDSEELVSLLTTVMTGPFLRFQVTRDMNIDNI